MSRFYANIQGNRGEATRQGTAKSGIYGHVRGRCIGASVNMHVGPDGEDRCVVQLTGGSRGQSSSLPLGQFSEKDLFLEKKRLDFSSARHWLESKVEAHHNALGWEWLYRTLKKTLTQLDNDAIQDLFESEMDRDGFFVTYALGVGIGAYAASRERTPEGRKGERA
jgi:hypothetical protein